MRTNVRSDDLQRLLSSYKRKEITNGNHRIAYGDYRYPPSPERCEGCPNHLACFANRQDEVLRSDGEWMTRPCYHENHFIEFYYHGSCCLVFEITTGAISDLGMWGYSATTNRSIGWYLAALAENFRNGPSPMRIGELKTFFKKRAQPRITNHDYSREDIGWVYPTQSLTTSGVRASAGKRSSSRRQRPTPQTALRPV